MSDTTLERKAIAIPAPRDLRRRLKRLAPVALALLIAAGVAAYGHHWWNFGRFIEATDDAYTGGNITAVSPHVAGFVTQIPVSDNHHVDAGQLLIRLDDSDYRAALDKATAAVAAQRAALANLDATRRLQEAIIAEAEAEQAAAEAERTRAELDVTRYRQLAADQVASTQRYQQADADAKKAEAAVAKAHAALTAARQQIAVIETQREQTQAALTQAIADQEMARLNLGYTELRSPIDGYVGNRAAQVGAYVASGAYLVSIIPAQGLWVDANFKEDQLARMRPGQPATVVADVLPGKIYHGHVESLAPGTGAVFSVIPPENATGNFTKIVQRVTVRIALDDGDARLGELRPGLSTTVSVDTRPETSAGE